MQLASDQKNMQNLEEIIWKFVYLKCRHESIDNARHERISS